MRKWISRWVQMRKQIMEHRLARKHRREKSWKSQSPYSLTNILTTGTVYRTMCYDHFSFLPVYLGIVIFESCETKDEILLT